ncbi:hypothetical protein C0995_000126 [Termitomyces sp. Mi166|nr:hypothetical protein C0995_000126 [Termitomyces sp. Mi166\
MDPDLQDDFMVPTYKGLPELKCMYICGGPNNSFCICIMSGVITNSALIKDSVKIGLKTEPYDQHQLSVSTFSQEFSHELAVIGQFVISILSRRLTPEPSSERRRYLTLDVTAYPAPHGPPIPFSATERRFLYDEIVSAFTIAKTRQQALSKHASDRQIIQEQVSHRVDAHNAKTGVDAATMLISGNCDEIERLLSFYTATDPIERGLRVISAMNFVTLVMTQVIYHPLRPKRESEMLFSAARTESNSQNLNTVAPAYHPPVQINDAEDEAFARAVNDNDIKKFKSTPVAKLVGLFFIIKVKEAGSTNRYYVKDLSSSFKGGLAIQYDEGDEEDIIVDHTVNDFFDMIVNAEAFWLRRG